MRYLHIPMPADISDGGGGTPLACLPPTPPGSGQWILRQWISCLFISNALTWLDVIMAGVDGAQDWPLRQLGLFALPQPVSSSLKSRSSCRLNRTNPSCNTGGKQRLGTWWRPHCLPKSGCLLRMKTFQFILCKPELYHSINHSPN